MGDDESRKRSTGTQGQTANRGEVEESKMGIVQRSTFLFAFRNVNQDGKGTRN